MMNLYNSDQQARDEALDPLQSFIVQAPAGSGKTELLTQRYLSLLSRAEKAPEEIIAITFTRKAAAEMRHRILTALNRASQNEKPAAPHHQKTWELARQVLMRDQAQHWQLQENPNRLQILTIDSLCGRICAQMPVLAKFGTKPDIKEKANDLYQQAAERTLEHLNPQSPIYVSIKSLLLHLDNKAERFTELLNSMLAKRDQWLPHVMKVQNQFELVKKDLELCLENIVREQLQHARQCLSHELEPIMLKMIRAAANYFLATDPNHELCVHAELTQLPNPVPQHLQTWVAFAKLFLTQEGEWRKTVNKTQGFPPHSEAKPQMMALLQDLMHHEPLRLALAQVLKSPPLHYSENQWQILEALLEVLPYAVAELNIIFQQQQCIDFIEQSLGTIRALGTTESPTDLALYLDYQIRHILIDEFQDTSLTQYRLIEQLIYQWDSRANKTLFLVGDPMQSIYRFRNAEVGLFLRTRQQGIGAMRLKPLTLYINFRAQPALVEWFNQTFVTIFPESPDINTGAISYTPAVTPPQTISQNSQQHPAVFYYPSSSEQTDTEAQQVCEMIQHYRHLAAQDSIAILTRSRQHLIHITEALHRAKIDFQAVEIESLAHHGEIQDLLTLTRALTNFADRVAWLALLRAPWCGLLLKDLLIVAQQSSRHCLWETLQQFSQIEMLSDDAHIRLQALVAVLREALTQRGRLPYSQWIKNTWLNLRGPDCVTHHNHQNFIEQFFALLRELEEQSCFINADYLEQELQRRFANIHASQQHCVQIMTIHKSKGLEFDHVIIPGLGRKSGIDAGELLLWQEFPNFKDHHDLVLAPIKAVKEDKDLIYTFLQNNEKIKLDHELVRLLYVAATRAKKTLHLFGQFVPDKKNPAQFKTPMKGSFLAMLYDVHHTALQPLQSEQPQNTSVLATNPATFQRLKTMTPVTLPQPEIISGQNLSLNMLSHNNFLESNVPRIVGTVIHEILFLIAEQGLTFWPSSLSSPQKMRWQVRLQQLGLPQPWLETATQVVSDAIEKTLTDERGRWILSSEHQDAHNEWALTGLANQSTTHIIIDRCFVDSEGTRWIIDYKTSIPNKDSMDLQSFLLEQKNKYQQQLHQYATILFALEQRPIHFGLYFPLCSAWQEWKFKF